MQLVKLSQLEEDAILGKDIRFGKNALLRKGMKLDKKYILALYSQGFDSVFIEDGKEDINSRLEGSISENTRSLAINTLLDVFSDFENFDEHQFAKITSVADQMVEDIIKNPEVEIQIHDLRTFDDYTYRHSVNVTALSLMIGRELTLPQNELKNLALGGLMHDVGKMRLSKSILNKKGRLKPEELMEVQLHPMWSYDILNERANIDKNIWTVALDHHEMLDGSGYPDNKVEKNIHPWVRIISIADIWDALRSHRPYKPEWSSIKAVNYFRSDQMLGKLDSTILKAFFDLVIPYPVGTIVRLSSGDIAIVTDQNKLNKTNPIVQIIQKSDGRRIDQNESDIINLGRIPSLTIEEALN